VVRDANQSARVARARRGFAPSQEEIVKKQKKRNSIRPPEIAGAGPMDWTPLFAAFKEAFEWALDVATGLARDFPEEVEAVERVRAYMRARIAGIPSRISIEDVLFTFGLIMGSIERDLGSVGAFGSWLHQEPMRFPSASELWKPRWLRQLVCTCERMESRPRATA
jgi:hypothetical protein